MKENDIGYLLAAAAVNILFVLIALHAWSIKKNWPRLKKWLERGALFMIIPFSLAAIANFSAQQPAWSVIIPLLMVFFLAAEEMFDSLRINNKSYLVLVIFRGLFFVMVGLGMMIYAFAGGTPVGFITMGTFAAAGWIGFISTRS